MDTSQLATVAIMVRDALPEARLVIAADDDWKKADNAGLRAARKAAAEVGGVVVSPEFGPDRGEKDTDWNDLHLRAGLGEVKRQLLGALEAGEPALGETDSPAEDTPVEKAPSRGLSTRLSDGTIVQLPQGYVLDDGSGIAREAFDRNGSPIKVRVCFPPVFLVGRSLDIATQSHFVTLATGWPALGSRMLHVPLEAVASTRSIVALASRGLPVTSNSAKAMVDYIDAARQLSEVTLKGLSRLSPTTGWVEGSFVRGYDEVHRPAGSAADLHMAPLEGEMRSKVEAVRARGDLAKWI
jgi:putative DNA primase/helicase